jgi:molybdenum cofactor cytidylyltransferase
VLAAGKGERMGPTRLGKHKLLEVVEGKPVIERAVSTFTHSKRVPEVVVVIAKGDMDAFGWLKSLHVHLVENPNPEGGMITSIRAGLGSAWAQERDFLIHPADVPFVKPEVVDRIVREFTTRSAKVLIPAYKGLGGHPGMYASDLRDDFFLRGDANGAKEILFRHRDRTVRLNLPDPDVCFDVDTPADLRIADDPGARWARVEQQAEARRVGKTR